MDNEKYAEKKVKIIDSPDLFQENQKLKLEVIRLTSSYEMKLKELEALRRADIALLSAIDLDEMLHNILTEISNLIQCDCTLIMLFAEEKEELELSAYQGNFKGKIPIRVKIDSGNLSAQTARKRNVIVVQNVRKDSMQQEYVKTINDPDERNYLLWVQSQASVPLIARGKLIGVITAQSPKRSGIQHADVLLLESFAVQAAIAIQNALLIIKNRQHTVLVAHQLRGPLQAIRGDVDYQIDYISRNYGNDERLQHISQRLEEHLNMIRKEMDNFTFLIREDGGVGHKFVKTHQLMQSIISEAVAQFKETARNKGVEFMIASNIHGLPRVQVDRENMMTVFTNLIDNAVKYSYANKTIYINAEGFRNGIVIRVESYGLGILPEDRERIFDLYTQGKLKDEKRFVQGTGIGLWVARNIIQEHGGNISVWCDLFKHPELTASNPVTIERGFLTVFSVELPFG